MNLPGLGLALAWENWCAFLGWSPDSYIVTDMPCDTSATFLNQHTLANRAWEYAHNKPLEKGKITALPVLLKLRFRKVRTGIFHSHQMFPEIILTLLGKHRIKRWPGQLGLNSLAKWIVHLLFQ